MPGDGDEVMIWQVDKIERDVVDTCFVPVEETNSAVVDPEVVRGEVTMDYRGWAAGQRSPCLATGANSTFRHRGQIDVAAAI